jgi:hypothetical protein
MLLWYANGIARLDKPTYHYFMNVGGMCRSEKTEDQALEFYLESYTNYSSLVSFFKDKNKEYYNIAMQVSCMNCYQSMVKAYEYHSERMFYKFRHELLSRYSSVLHQQVGSKISVILRMPASYHVLLAYLSLGQRLKDKQAEA